MNTQGDNALSSLEEAVQSAEQETKPSEQDKEDSLKREDSLSEESPVEEEPSEQEESLLQKESFVFTGEEGESAIEDEADEEEGLPPEALPELDPELAKNPALLKRWQEQQKGVEKLVNRWKANLDILGQTVTKLSAIQSYVEKFEDPKSWKEGLKDLAERLSKHYGEPIENLFGVSQKDGEDSWDMVDKNTLKEVEERAYQRAVKEIEQKLAPALDFLSEQMLEKQVLSQTKETVTKLEKVYGMKISEDAVRRALLKYPNLDPVAAFNACYAPQIAQHYAKYRDSLSQKKPKHELPNRERLSSNEKRELQPGATLEEILEGEF